MKQAAAADALMGVAERVASGYAYTSATSLPATRPRADASHSVGQLKQGVAVLKRIIATAVALLLSASYADAQYFGRNKVQYDRFQFAILETAHFDVYYYPQERAAAEIAAQLAERWYGTLSQTLDDTFARRQPIILYASHAHFVQTAIIPGTVPEGVGGFTDHLAGRVVLPFAAGLGETDHVLGHELVHAFQRDILRKEGRSLAMLPLWFSEGMAEYLSVGDLDANTRMWLRDAVAAKRVPTIPQLSNPKYFPYRYGQALWAFMASRYGHDVVLRALTARAPNGIARLEAASGKRESELTEQWREYVTAVAGSVPAAATRDDRADAKPVSPAHALIGGAAHDGHLNVGPSLSPDGRLLVFLSERDRHAVDVFLADATTGMVTRQLSSTATDPHFDALQFIESAGAWDPLSRSFVLATVSNGRPVLTIFDMPSGRVRHRVEVAQVDQIFSPTWSPDGGRIAFSGMKGGVTDIYVIDLATGEVMPLTNDAYSDLQPSWSPDGSEIAFSTDRFSSSVEDLQFGRYELGAIAWPSGAISYLGGTPSGKSIDPHWAGNGTLYFVSDETGISNVYRFDRASASVTRVTDEPIGVSGITALSPAISVGDGGSRVAMSVYSQGDFTIHALDVNHPSAGVDAATEKVIPRQLSRVASSLTGSVTQTTSFQQRAYSPNLSLFQLGQPYLSAGGGAFGSFLLAGMSFGIGDLFGQQELDTSVQAGKRASDFAWQTTYINRRSRWNWGVAASQVPWLVGAGLDTRASTSASGQPVTLRDAMLDRQEHRQLSGLLIYPFTRSRRIEMSAGIDSVGFARDITTTTYATSTLKQVSQSTTTIRTARPATSFVSGAAFVHDTAVFGMTSPILGERYRFGLTTSVGDLNVATASGDFRRYFSPMNGLTVATRAQQVWRFGPDVSDPRMLPLVWSAREVVRGFVRDSVAERASGLSLAQMEMRMPLAPLFGRPAGDTALPIELFTFSDWARFTAPRSLLFPPDSRQLWSVGAGARINAAGFIFEFNAARPVTPSHGWTFVVNFRPGF
jgi:Tol biopolymer transport system component